MVVLGGPSGTAGTALSVITEIAEHFGPGQIVVGPEVSDLVDAATSARGALSGIRAADAWPSAPRPVAAEDLLPERALAGDGHARRMLAREIYGPLRDAGADLLETLVAYLDNSGSVEATATHAVRPSQHRPVPAAAHRRGLRLPPGGRPQRLCAAARGHARPADDVVGRQKRPSIRALPLSQSL